MNGIYLLDTNAAVARLANDAKITIIIRQAETVYISTIVLGELYFGAEKSARVAENLQRIEEFVAGMGILNVDKDTAREYGRIVHQLQIKGRPIPRNDIWIAAVALQYDLTLLTRDEHFKVVAGLTTQDW